MLCVIISFSAPDSGHRVSFGKRPIEIDPARSRDLLLCQGKLKGPLNTSCIMPGLDSSTCVQDFNALHLSTGNSTLAYLKRHCQYGTEETVETSRLCGLRCRSIKNITYNLNPVTSEVSESVYLK